MYDAHAEAVETAIGALGEIAERDAPLGPLTTYRVGGNADVFVRLRTRDDIATLVEARRSSGLPILIVGRGSNLLIADAGFRGIAVSAIELLGADDIALDVEHSRVTAGSGVSLPVLARRTAAASLTGFEWAVGVPGSVGGAVRMNAGGHGSDMSASLTSVTVADLGADPGSAIMVQMDADRLGLRFRGSAVPASHFVLDATLQLAPGDRASSEREISEIVHWRRANQPGGQNAGSVFVNPIPGEVTCGALIDGAGLRGMRHRSAVVSDKHANFIQADESGSADDVRDLMRIVRERVEAASGHRLRSEIRLVGFEDEF